MLKRRMARQSQYLQPGRVLHLTSAHPWTDNRIHRREAISLSNAGYDVGLYAVENGMELPTTIRVSTNAEQKRLTRITVGTVKSLRVALASRASIVHIHDPELVWTIPILKLGKRKVIYDAHEDLPAQVMDKPYIPKALRAVIGLSTLLIVKVANGSDRVVAATETIAKRFDPKKTIVVRNFPHSPSEEIEPTPPRQRGLSAVYVGAVSANRGGSVMVDAFNSAHIPHEWKLEIAGAITSEYATALKVRPGWQKVNFHGKVSPPDARQLISQSRVGIVALKNTVAYRDALPTKMFEYMADGTAVIASDFPLWRSIIEKYECGILVDQDNPDDIAKAISAYASDPELLELHSRNGINAARDQLNWEMEAEKLIAMYGSLESPKNQ